MSEEQEQEKIPSWWRVPRTKLPEDIRPGDVVQTPKGERKVKSIRRDDTFVVDYFPAPEGENRGPDKQVLGRDQYQTITELGERMPSNDEIVEALEAVREGQEFYRTGLSTAAFEEAKRRGWIEQGHRLTMTGAMVLEQIAALRKKEPTDERQD